MFKNKKYNNFFVCTNISKQNLVSKNVLLKLKLMNNINLYITYICIFSSSSLTASSSIFSPSASSFSIKSRLDSSSSALSHSDSDNSASTSKNLPPSICASFSSESYSTSLLLSSLWLSSNSLPLSLCSSEFLFDSSFSISDSVSQLLFLFSSAISSSSSRKIVCNFKPINH